LALFVWSDNFMTSMSKFRASFSPWPTGFHVDVINKVLVLYRYSLKKLFKTFTYRCWFVELIFFAVLTSFWNFEAEIGDRNFVYFLDVVSIFCQNFVNRNVLDLRNLIGGLEHKTRKAESVSVPHLKINWIC